jgi:hypothetical protein
MIDRSFDLGEQQPVNLPGNSTPLYSSTVAGLNTYY